MRVDRLYLKRFRNIEESSFHPSPTVNFLIGSNGQGKTSFLEAIGFLSSLRSFRDSRPASVIQWGDIQTEISCTLLPDDPAASDWKTQLKVIFQTEEPDRQKTLKTAFINDKPYRSSTEYLCQRFGSFELGFHAIVFNPSNHDLVRGDPMIRRAYLDRVLMAEDAAYLKTFQKYQRILEQRNAALKIYPDVSQDVLMGFTEPLARLGALIAYQRLEWISRASARLTEINHRIAPHQSDLRMVYFSNWVPELENLSYENSNLHGIHFTGQGPLPSLKLLEQAFWDRVSESEAAERRARHSLVGPHRDDWGFFLGNHLLKGHGSQGEVRSALLALKLCELELFRSKTGHRPLFLLDDFSSELDRERRSFLLQFLMDTDLQTFVTTTEDSLGCGKRYWVNQGRIHPEEMVEERNYDRSNTGSKSITGF